MQRGQKTGRPTEKRAYWRASFTSFTFVSTLFEERKFARVIKMCQLISYEFLTMLT
jgi:hypothetical protein